LPDTRVLLPLVVFFALGAAVLWLVWRVVLAGGRARRERVSAVAVAELAGRTERQLCDLIAVVDNVRRRKIAPQDVEVSVLEAQEALERTVEDASALCHDPAWSAVAAALVADIHRAERAIDLIDHGARLLADVAAVDAGEGETAVKRGYLNLVHAREAIRERREAILEESRTRRRTTGD